MKKTICCLILITLIFCGVPGSAVAAPSVILNGQTLYFEVNPVIEGGYVFVPLRTIFECLGASIQWDNTTQTVIATKDNSIIKLTIGSNTAYVNNQVFELPAAPRIIAGRTMVPLRFVSESFGASVIWDANTQTITINSQSNIGNNTTIYGKYEYPDGTYEGEMLNGLKNGRGTMNWLNGHKYVGDWINGIRTGQGAYYWPSGDSYIGSFLNNKCNGQGTYTWSNGERYIGEFQNDMRTGQGSYYWPNGDSYTGSFLDNKFNGQGTFTWATGDKYAGNWFNDLPHGKGTFYSNGRSMDITYSYGTIVASTSTYQTTYPSTVFPTYPASESSNGVIESRIDGNFEGWDGDTIFILMNGQIWQQSSYNYHYHYSYSPKVIIYPSNGGYKMHVEGVDRDIYVVRLK
jgi:hypothetical protein